MYPNTPFSNINIKFLLYARARLTLLMTFQQADSRPQHVPIFDRRDIFLPAADRARLIGGDGAYACMYVCVYICMYDV
jgi:hypothetical protein